MKSSSCCKIMIKELTNEEIEVERENERTRQVDRRASIRASRQGEASAFGFDLKNEDTCELLSPCTVCTQNCYKIHGKHKHTQCSNGSFSFFKVMLGHFSEKLPIPPAIVPKLLNQTDGNMVLQGPSGQEWVVELWGTSTQLEFLQGWEEFVRHYALEHGDCLVFKYISRAYFNVCIFGRSGCEKNITTFDSKKTNCDLMKRCPNTKLKGFNPFIKNKLIIDFVSEDEDYDEDEAIAKNQTKSHKPSTLGQPSLVKTTTKKLSYKKPYYISCRLPVTKAERDEALQVAQSFTSDKPFCLKIMKPSNVYHGYVLVFPKGCSDHLQLPRERTQVALVDPNTKREWQVQYIWRDFGSRLVGGWRYFSSHNNLEEGDVCVFERVDNNENKFILKVHIFRVVEVPIPYKKMRLQGR